MEAALNSITANLSRPVLPDNVIHQVPDACVKLSDDYHELLQGVLTLVERSIGVFIEWTPTEDGNESTGWVITGGSEENIASHSLNSPDSDGSKDLLNKLKFSIDVCDLSSYKYLEPKDKGQGYPFIRFICRDGSSPMALYFRTTSVDEFLEKLRGYLSLRISAHDPSLTLVVDGNAGALAKSVTDLDFNGGILSRFLNKPCETALTGFGKITSLMQDHVYPVLLDSDAVEQEEHIRAMRDLRRRDEDATDLRIHTETEFEVVTQLNLPDRPVCERISPLTKELFEVYKNADGSIDARHIHTIKSHVFRGGIEPDLRKDVWKLLLDYRDWSESDESFVNTKHHKENTYENMKHQWLSITDDQELRFASYSKRKGLVEKDVARTDRTLEFYQGPNNSNLQMLHCILMTYIMHDFDLGYVQGMSDFASQLLYIMDDEQDAFWCFVGFMKRIHPNFEEDQTHIKLQLNQLFDLVMVVNPKLANYLECNQSEDMYFCFRWVLVWFKREFSFHDTSRLWEVVLTDHPCPNFLLLVCVAILDREANTIMQNNFGLTEILKHVNDLSMHLNLDEVLSSAESIYLQLSTSQDKLPSHICKYLKLGDMSMYSD
ncbi:unnamed protein product [Auanema sp. JU1783]|nr:unnamed protein product [Auanema sp. JU1783]